MKILYIDPIYQTGHVNFNQIYIDYLYSKGYKIDFIFISDYAKFIKTKSTSYILNIEWKFLKGKHSPLINRIIYFTTLLYIKHKSKFYKYDKVIFSSFEEISFFFSGIKGCYLINHVNIQGLHSPIKLYFFKSVFLHNIAVVLGKDSYSFLSSLIPPKNILYSSHGLPCPYEHSDNSKYVNILSHFKHIIFSPSGNSSDSRFLEQLFISDSLNLFLKETNTVIVIRSHSLSIPPFDNFIIINKFLSPCDYQYIFLKADWIILAYPPTFKFRASGVLFECFANNKQCFLSAIPAMLDYKNHFLYNPYFSNIKELIERIQSSKECNDCIYFKGLDQLHPSIF